MAYKDKVLHKDKINAVNRKWYFRHKDEQHIKQKEYREKKKDEAKVYQKKYREERKDYFIAYRLAHQDEFYAKSLKRKYGLSVEEYSMLVQKQRGVCAVCGNTWGSRLHVDHDHKTGKVRALLCFKCNLVLGLINDDVVVVKRMVEYLNG